MMDEKRKDVWIEDLYKKAQTNRTMASLPRGDTTAAVFHELSGKGSRITS